MRNNRYIGKRITWAKLFCIWLDYIRIRQNCCYPEIKIYWMPSLANFSRLVVVHLEYFIWWNLWVYSYGHSRLMVVKVEPLFESVFAFPTFYFERELVLPITNLESVHTDKKSSLHKHHISAIYGQVCRWSVS